MPTGKKKTVDETIETLRGIMESNPHVEPERVKKALGLLKQLREEGVERSQYGLLHPYSRGVRRSTEEEPDPRLVRLSFHP